MNRITATAFRNAAEKVMEIHRELCIALTKAEHAAETEEEHAAVIELSCLRDALGEQLEEHEDRIEEASEILS